MQNSSVKVDLHASHIRSTVGVNGEQHCVVGMVNLTLSFDGLRVSFPFHVVNSLHHTIITNFLFIVTPIVGVCNCSMFCCTLLYVHSSIAIILMGKRGS